MDGFLLEVKLNSDEFAFFILDDVQKDILHIIISHEIKNRNFIQSFHSVTWMEWVQFFVSYLGRLSIDRSYVVEMLLRLCSDVRLNS